MNFVIPMSCEWLRREPRCGSGPGGPLEDPPPCRRATGTIWQFSVCHAKKRHFRGECSWIPVGKARKCGRFSGCLRASQILVNKASGDSVLQVLGNKARKNCQIVPALPTYIPPFPHCNWRALPSSHSPSRPTLPLPLPHTPPVFFFFRLSGAGDSQCDSRESIRAKSFAIETPIFIARQADSHESLEFPIRTNHPIRTIRANRFARITPLSFSMLWEGAAQAGVGGPIAQGLDGEDPPSGTWGQAHIWGDSRERESRIGNVRCCFAPPSGQIGQCHL